MRTKINIDDFLNLFLYLTIILVTALLSCIGVQHISLFSINGDVILVHIFINLIHPYTHHNKYIAYSTKTVRVISFIIINILHNEKH